MCSDKEAFKGREENEKSSIPELEIAQSYVWGKESDLSYDWEIHLNFYFYLGLNPYKDWSMILNWSLGECFIESYLIRSGLYSRANQDNVMKQD